jgi:hypothetical protein
MKVLRNIKPKETSQIAVVTGSKRNRWDNLNNMRRETSRHLKNKKETISKRQN